MENDASSDFIAEETLIEEPSWKFAWHDKCESRFNTTPRATKTGRVECERHTCRLICNDSDMIIAGRVKVTCKLIGDRPVWSGKLGTCRMCQNPNFKVARAERLSFNCRMSSNGLEEMCDVKCVNGFIFQRNSELISKPLICNGSSKTWDIFDEGEFKCRRKPYRRRRHT
ncbi:Oidioi.mRNA.OKI2018_I69.chr1.g2086.t1.cds [Oikopleura dioica]|uniref:Oidioi.mRNA.OKI2018_I69.chr1.g2086.t1.cds n=1 Tax=Oikopleura dioica TaxID=34765 RepID=A0ABN7SW95_OIKDI|nr:Oidioi.mRNA.OKI2018_I69.chr1.g2086.t1.cds [Oikopleura dioica]